MCNVQKQPRKTKKNLPYKLGQSNMITFAGLLITNIYDGDHIGPDFHFNITSLTSNVSQSILWMMMMMMIAIITRGFQTIALSNAHIPGGCQDPAQVLIL